MQLVLRTVESYIDGSVAARTKGYLLTAALVYRTITDDPQIRAERLLVRFEDFLQVYGSGFLLAFKHQLDVRLSSDGGCAQGVECHGHRHDGSLVVGCGSRIETPFRIEGRSGRRECDDLAVFIERAVTQGGSK